QRGDSGADLSSVRSLAGGAEAVGEVLGADTFLDGPDGLPGVPVDVSGVGRGLADRFAHFVADESVEADAFDGERLEVVDLGVDVVGAFGGEPVEALVERLG